MKTGGSVSKETKDLFMANASENDYDGQLAVDVYQNNDSVIIKAPIAGVNPEDLDLSISNDMVTIKGYRKEEHQISREDYFCQECYWGGFSRAYSLPTSVDADKAEASLKNGILTVTIPKTDKGKTKSIKIKSE